MKKNILKRYFILLFAILLTGCKTQQYIISFDSNGGTSIDDIYVNEGNSFLEPEEPTKEGYTFDGWYGDEALTNGYIFSTVPEQDITLYAKWMINQYSLTYIDYIDTQIVSISLGTEHTLAITSNGHIFSWGRNDSGQLGDGTTENKTTPTEITSQFNLNEGESITSIEAGSYHTVALTSDGRIFTWGWNHYGQLGDGTSGLHVNKTTPTEITSQFNLNEGESITSIEVGSYHTVALTSEGRIFTWGNNEYGQLGNGTTDDKNTPTEITSQFNLDVDESIISIEIGNYHTIAQTSEGHIFIWGRNDYGQVGDGTTDNKLTPTEIRSQFNLNADESIISIDGGFLHTVAQTSEGRVFTWGYNDYGQLGDGTTDNKLIPTDITTQFNLNTGESIISIETKFSQSAAITSEDRVFIWGNNDVLPESIISESVYEHKVTLASEVDTFTWVNNDYRHLRDETTDYKLTPSEITSLFNLNEEESITSIEFGAYHKAAITSEGRILTWGCGHYGQLGAGPILCIGIPIDIQKQFPKVLSENGVQNYEYGNPIDTIIPIKKGYTFDGWYIDEFLTTPFALETMPSKDITLYAKWVKETL